MGIKFNPVKGMHDLLPAYIQKEDYILEKIKKVVSSYNFHPIETPILEESKLFCRTIGDESDIVSKELYTFNDKDKRELAMRPEFTASVVRALISNGLQQQLPQKLYSYGPLFRHERPQSLRYRQFKQFNCEFIGAYGYMSDLEILLMAYDILQSLQLPLDDNLTLQLNSLGGEASRIRYRELLVSYLNQNYGSLSELSRSRLAKNPLRILDSKEPSDIAIIAGAPRLEEALIPEDKHYFDNILSQLQKFSINFTVNPYLVRGLDYYSHTVFEFTTNLVGTQNAILSGGRYDKLVHCISDGASDIPAIGFAMGVDRTIGIMEKLALFKNIAPETPFIYTITTDQSYFSAIMPQLHLIRQAGISIENDFTTTKLGKGLQRANKLNCPFALIIGESEMQQSGAKIKNMLSGDEIMVAFEQLVDYLVKLAQSHEKYLKKQ